MIGEDRALRVVPRRAEEDVTVVFQKAGHDCEDDDEDVECAAERIILRTNSHIRPDDDDDDKEATFDYADDEEEAKTRGRKKRSLCPPGMCFTNRHGEDLKHPGASFGNGMLACLLINPNDNNRTANESCTFE